MTTVPKKVSNPVHPFIVCIGIAILLTLVQGAFLPALAQGPQDYIVTFRDGTIPAVRAAAANNAGAALRFNYSIVNAIAVTVPNATALAALGNDPSVLSIVPDRAVFALQQANGKGGTKGKPPKDEDPPEDPPADPPPTVQELPSGVKRVGANPDLGGPTGAGVGVAIVDTGIDFAHADLGSVVKVYDAFGGTCQDDNGHGTHVAGIVAAQDNDIDVVGVAPGATLYCVKALDASGSGSDSTIMAGLNAIATGTFYPPIKVVNMSLGRPGSLDDSEPLRAAIQALYVQNIAVVVSAGNNPNVEVTAQVPATYPEVMAVASTTAIAGTNACRRLNSTVGGDTASYFTTDGAFNIETGIGVTISPPGEKLEDISKRCFLSPAGIISTQLGGGTTRKYGTSMAAPHVAGIVARMYELELESNLPVDVITIRSDLRTNAAAIGNAPLGSPSSAYTFDTELEGIAQVPQ